MMSSSWTFLNTTGSTSENKARTLNIYSIIYVTCTETLNQRNFSGMEIWTRKWFICTYFVKRLGDFEMEILSTHFLILVKVKA